MSVLGQPLDRTDGLLKVTDQVKYSADNPEAKLAHAVLVTSTIAHGRVASMDTARIQAMPGVLLVMTHETAMRLPNGGKPNAEPPVVRGLSLLQTDEVRYSNEPVAVGLVVADTLERATDGARKLQASIRYEAATPNTDYQRAKSTAYQPEKMMGRPINTQRGGENARHQGRKRARDLPVCRWRFWMQRFGLVTYRTCCHGREADRPVRLVLERPQMFGMVANRPRLCQNAWT